MAGHDRAAIRALAAYTMRQHATMAETMGLDAAMAAHAAIVALGGIADAAADPKTVRSIIRDYFEEVAPSEGAAADGLVR